MKLVDLRILVVVSMLIASPAAMAETIRCMSIPQNSQNCEKFLDNQKIKSLQEISENGLEISQLEVSSQMAFGNPNWLYYFVTADSGQFGKCRVDFNYQQSGIRFRCASSRPQYLTTSAIDNIILARKTEAGSWELEIN